MAVTLADGKGYYCRNTPGDLACKAYDTLENMGKRDGETVQARTSADGDNALCETVPFLSRCVWPRRGGTNRRERESFKV